MQDTVDDLELGELVPDYPELQGFAKSLLAGYEELVTDTGASADTNEWSSRQSLTLDLGDLLSGDTGEVVLASEAQLSLTSTALVTDAGFVDQHMTADGEDVSGFAYLSFETGVTVYYPCGADLVLDAIVS